MPCDVCGRKGTGVEKCDDCGREICLNHVDDHDCDGGGIKPEHLEGIQPEMKTNWGESDSGGSGWGSESSSGEPRTSSTSSTPNQSQGGSRGNLIAGAILMATGAVLTVTAVGALIGVPLGMLGFGVMFPRFTKAMIGLSILSFLFLVFVLL